MELRFVIPNLRRLEEAGCEVLACGLFSDETPPHGTAGLIDWRLAGQVSRLLRSRFVTGARREVVMVPLRPKLPFDKALLFGLGERSAFDESVFREAVGAMLETLQGLCARSAVVELPGRQRGAIGPEQATDILLDLAGDRPEHDAWTLIEEPDDQKRISARMIEQRRRDRRVVLGENR